VKKCVFLLYVHYMHSGYRTSICGKNCAYCIQIFTVVQLSAFTVFKLEFLIEYIRLVASISIYKIV